MNRNSNDVTVAFWWTPDCGYLHLENNPVVVDLYCPHRDRKSLMRRLADEVVARYGRALDGLAGFR